MALTINKALPRNDLQLNYREKARSIRRLCGCPSIRQTALLPNGNRLSKPVPTCRIRTEQVRPAVTSQARDRRQENRRQRLVQMGHSIISDMDHGGSANVAAPPRHAE